jgi:methylmalonyl-CoA mutase
LQALYALFDNCNSLHTNAYDEAITTPTPESVRRAVEEAVYQEFERISERGVLGAMDTMYQRGKIQEESLYYEHKKHDGTLPLVGVNTFLPEDGHGEVGEIELMRSSDEEKNQQVANVENFRDLHAEEAKPLLQQLQQVARERKNTFDALVKAARVCSLGSMSHALYDVGGEYRRNM